MTELPIPNGSDALSRLVQLRARMAGIRVNWVGRGAEDLDALCLDYSNKYLLNQCLWNGMQELMKMPELKELPESVQAKIASIILQAQAIFELKIKERNAKAEAAARPKGAA